ncbi:MAG: cytochrome c [Burkholderiales bacterium]|nr:cytochrome c [Burkholderiales bacterium]
MIARLFTFVAAALIAAPLAAAGNPERGKQKADQVCASCHAVGGDWNKSLQPEYPRLAGQHRDYLVTALMAYKHGDKSQIGRKNAIMAGQAAALSRQEIEDIAAFLSALPGSLHLKR